jgi:hypothetical protein
MRLQCVDETCKFSLVAREKSDLLTIENSRRHHHHAISHEEHAPSFESIPVGSTWNTREKLQGALFAAETKSFGGPISVIKSAKNAHHMRLQCVDESCKFSLVAREKSGLWTITKLGRHLNHGLRDNKVRQRKPKRQALAAASPYLSAFTPTASVGSVRSSNTRALIQSVENENKVSVSESQARRLVRDHLGDDLNDHLESYFQLYDFFKLMRECDPDGVYLLELERLDGVVAEEANTQKAFQFKRCLCIPSVSKKFWQKSRKCAAQDGAHKTTYIGGVLLTFNVKAADNSILPLAAGSVSVENRENWVVYLPRDKGIARRQASFI